LMSAAINALQIPNYATGLSLCAAESKVFRTHSDVDSLLELPPVTDAQSDVKVGVSCQIKKAEGEVNAERKIQIRALPARLIV
jgi:hypothetical protein